jgi:hypothetical protein
LEQKTTCIKANQKNIPVACFVGDTCNGSISLHRYLAHREATFLGFSYLDSADEVTAAAVVAAAAVVVVAAVVVAVVRRISSRCTSPRAVLLPPGSFISKAAGPQLAS